MRRTALLLVIALCACSRRRPNVLLVTFDTTRADRVGFVSGKAGTTPTLDALAASGTAFTTAIASQPLTAPSHATILTGQQPFHHGVRNNGAYVLAPAALSLAERLRAAGYSTHAIVASYVLDSRFGLDQGFDSYDDDLSAGRGAQREIDARHVADKALRWLAQPRKDDQPFFLWLHFYDPHAAYAPPRDIARAFASDLYAGEIHYADRELGRVIEDLRSRQLLDDTIVVFTADHGESFGEHGERGHGLFVYDATTRVPLLFSGGAVPRSRRVDDVVRHVDIVPTILDLVGIRDAAGLDGASLQPLWQGHRAEARHAYSESFAARMNFGWSELRSMRSAGLRVVDAPHREAYDLTRDGERRNIDGPQLPAGTRPMFAELARIAASDDFQVTSTAVDDETRRKLAALGYVMSASQQSAADRPDPKERVAAWNAYANAQDLLRRRDYRAAAAALEALHRSEPASSAAASLLASALASAGRREEALAVLKDASEREPRNAAFHLARAALLRDDAQYGEASALANAVLLFEPASVEARVSLAETATAYGDFADAERWLRESLRIDPSSTTAAAALGNALNRSSKTAEALAVLEDAHRRDPNSHALAYNLGVVYEKSGRIDDALKAYRDALRLDPEHSMTWNNLGSLLDRRGKRTEAVKLIARARALDPENVEATYNLGALLLETRRPREAAPLLAEAVRRRPELMAARLRLAAALEQSGQRREAIAEWTAIAAQQPRAWIKVASLELQRGDRAAARVALARGVELVGAPMIDAARRDPALHALVK